VVDRSNAQAAGKIVVASKYIQKKVKQAYNRRAVVCGLGGDSKIFSPASKKKPQILFIGDENEVSGYYFAKKVMELVTQKSQVSFCPISFQKGRPKLTDKQLAKKYAESLLTLCTSYQEPYGLIVTESMMSGTPVLAVAEGGYRETVLDGKTGYLLKRDVQDFAAKINYLLTHPQKLTTMSIMAARYAKEKFSWQEHAKKLEGLLES
jgi:glycosyltransferase involved in cell wall biosynthesis